MFYDSFSDHSLPLATTAATERRNGSPTTPQKGCKMGQFSRHKGRNYNSVVSSTPFVLLKTGWVGGWRGRARKKRSPISSPPLFFIPRPHATSFSLAELLEEAEKRKRRKLLRLRFNPKLMPSSSSSSFFSVSDPSKNAPLLFSGGGEERPFFFLSQLHADGSWVGKRPKQSLLFFFVAYICSGGLEGDRKGKDIVTAATKKSLSLCRCLSLSPV